MRYLYEIEGIDTHVAGEPSRVILGGMPPVEGETILEKKEYMVRNLDHIRRALMHEPRGHKDMFGSVVFPPTREDAQAGVVFIDGGGYLNMCGHGTIGTVTCLLETGRIKMEEPVTRLNLETPSGLVKAEARIKDGKVIDVSFVNVPSFLYCKDGEVELDGRKIKFEISFGGSFFALVDIKETGLEISSEYSYELVDFARKLRDKINRQVKVKHPLMPHINQVDLVEIYGETTNPKADLKNVVVFGAGQIDRSPCGTGTSAKLASLYSKGKIGVGEKFVYESIIGTSFTGEIIGTTKIGDYEAILPKITGKGSIVALNKFVIDKDDDLKYGFIV